MVNNSSDPKGFTLFPNFGMDGWAYYHTPKIKPKTPDEESVFKADDKAVPEVNLTGDALPKREEPVEVLLGSVGGSFAESSYGSFSYEGISISPIPEEIVTWKEKYHPRIREKPPADHGR